MSNQELPRRPGYGKTERVEPCAALQTPGSSCIDSLAALSRDYQLFTHALFFPIGHLLVDPVGEFLVLHNLPDDAVNRLVLPSPLLVGLDGYHEHVLFLVAHEVWPALFAFLSEVSGLSRSRRRFWRAMAQRVEVVDILTLRRPGPPALVPICVMGIDGTDGKWHVLPAPVTLPTQLVVRRAPADPVTCRLGQLLLGESPMPYEG